MRLETSLAASAARLECLSSSLVPNLRHPLQIFAWASRDAPKAHTEGEGEFSASVIGCSYYVLVAIIWSVIWCAAAAASLLVIPALQLCVCLSYIAGMWALVKECLHMGQRRNSSLWESDTAEYNSRLVCEHLFTSKELSRRELLACVGRIRYFGLDPIKWAMMWILNEDGFRDMTAHKLASARRPRVRRYCYKTRVSKPTDSCCDRIFPAPKQS